MACCGKQKCCVISLVIGILLVVLGIVMIFVVKIIERNEVLKNVVLAENSSSMAYQIWKEPKLPIYLQFYVFDLKNPDDVLIHGAKPRLQEKGPYTYRECVKKEDITYHENGTVSYRQYKHWQFVRSMSVGNDSEDQFTTANIPLLTVVEALLWEPSWLQKAFTLFLKLYGEKLFITKTVHEVIWGYPDPMLTAAKRYFPTWIYSDFVGIYAGKNNTSDGLYSIHTGEDDWKKLGIIDTFNDTRYLSFWTTNSANMINGSDGTIFPPFMDKKDVLHSFISDICRSVYSIYADDAHSDNGIPLWRFTGPRAAFEGGADNPDNAGFCTPAGNCLGDGLLNMTECRMFDHFHVPIISSSPHFYMADKKYLDAVEGLKPIPEQHRTDIFIEPITGLPLKIFKRLQINIYIQSNPFIGEMENVTTVVYPMLWLNESVVADQEHLNQLYSMLFLPMTAATVGQYSMIGIGTVLILLTVFAGLYLTYKREQIQFSTLDEEEPSVNA